MTTNTAEQRETQDTYWYTESQDQYITTICPEKGLKFKRSLDGRTEHINVDGENLTRDEEILDRYRVMIEHYEKHPELMATERNYSEMVSVWMSDRVLRKNERLRGRLGKVMTESAFIKFNGLNGETQ